MKKTIEGKRRVYVSFVYSHPDHDHRQLQLFAENMEVLKVSHHGRRFYRVEAMLRASLKVVTSKAHRQRFERPPGARLNAFASFFFSKCIYETVLRPSLAEMQEEYFEALSKGETRKAKWVWIRGIISFWSISVLQLFTSFASLAKKLRTISGG